MNAAADESGVNEINKTIKAAANPQKFGVDKIREASGLAAPKNGSETEKLKTQLSEERAANKAKIDAAMAKAAEDRKEKEAADVTGEAPVAKPAAPRKTAATKAKAEATAKTPTAKKPAANKATAKKPAATKSKAKPAAKPKAKTTKAKPAKDAT